MANRKSKTQMTDAWSNTDDREFNLINIIQENNASALLDNWGPEQIFQVYDPEINMQGILVVDNTTLGPGCGGIKLSPHITPNNIFQHARTMTWACALAGVKLGGAAGGIRGNPLAIDKSKFIKSFAQKISPYVPNQYVAAPFPPIGKEEMAVFAEEVGDRKGAVGKPEHMGGIPQETGIIGLGMGVAIEECIKIVQSFPKNPSDIRIVIQGFEHIGRSLAQYLVNKGLKIIAISDDWCTVYDPKGINLDTILKYSCALTENTSLKRCKEITKLSKNDIQHIDCDILVCTTGNCLVTHENIQDINIKCIVEGINRPVTPVAEQIFHEKGVLVLPDTLTLVSSAVCSYAEYNMDSSEMAFSLMEKKIREVSQKVIDQSLNSNIPPRRVAKEIARERILQRMEAKA